MQRQWSLLWRVKSTLLLTSKALLCFEAKKYLPLELLIIFFDLTQHATLPYHLPALTWAIIFVPFTLLLIAEEDKTNQLTKQDLQVLCIDWLMNRSQLLEEGRIRRGSWMMDLGVRGENKGESSEWYKQTQTRFLSSHFEAPSRMDLLIVASSPSNPVFFETTHVFVSASKLNLVSTVDRYCFNYLMLNACIS